MRSTGYWRPAGYWEPLIGSYLRSVGEIVLGSGAALGTFRVLIGRHEGGVGLKKKEEGGPKEVKGSF